MDGSFTLLDEDGKAILEELEFSMDHYKPISLLAHPNTPIFSY
jgi:hypothetical protein